MKSVESIKKDISYYIPYYGVRLKQDYRLKNGLIVDFFLNGIVIELVANEPKCQVINHLSNCAYSDDASEFIIVFIKKAFSIPEYLNDGRKRVNVLREHSPINIRQNSWESLNDR